MVSELWCYLGDGVGTELSHLLTWPNGNLSKRDVHVRDRADKFL